MIRMGHLIAGLLLIIATALAQAAPPPDNPFGGFGSQDEAGGFGDSRDNVAVSPSFRRKHG